MNLIDLSKKELTSLYPNVAAFINYGFKFCIGDQILERSGDVRDITADNLKEANCRTIFDEDYDRFVIKSRQMINSSKWKYEAGQFIKRFDTIQQAVKPIRKAMRDRSAPRGKKMKPFNETVLVNSRHWKKIKGCQSLMEVVKNAYSPHGFKWILIDYR